MKILITTGIFAPEPGGPATYTPQLAQHLNGRGHEVTVVTFASREYMDGDEKYPFTLVRIPRHGPSKIPGKRSLTNYWRLLRWLRKNIADYDIAYTLSWVSCGGPLMLAALSKRVPYVVRVGGGYIWEKYLDEGKPPMPLRDFYAKGIYRNYPTMFFFIKRVLKNARHVVFNTDPQRTLFTRYYALRGERVSTIYNPMSRIDLDASRDVRYPDKEIVFAGRLIAMKNVDTLVRAFAHVEDKEYHLRIIGDGPQRDKLERIARAVGIGDRVIFEPAKGRDELYQSIINCAFVVLPSWTEFSPNQIAECLSLGIPFLVTDEHYLPMDTSHVLTIDPRSIDDVAEKMNALTSFNTYASHVSELHKLSVGGTWLEVTRQHEKLFRKVIDA